MGRFPFFIVFASVAGILCGNIGCGKPGPGVTAKTISITPSVLSLELGAAASVTVRDSGGATVSPATITWISTPASAVTVTTGGALCAGQWDSLTSPTFCSPGSPGTVQLTAAAEGATSAPITVYVHQHIERLTTKLVGQPACPLNPPPPPTYTCLSAASLNAPACFANYEARALNNNQDITASVGPINWSAVNSNVVSLSTTAPGLLFNQVQATATIPGQTQLYPSVGASNGTPQNFAVCPVDSVTLQTAAGGTSLNLTKGNGTQLITATVTSLDSSGTQELTLINPPLTWTTTNPTVVSVSGTSSVPTTGTGSETDSISPLQPGGAGISAACLPPSCNSGFTNPLYSPPVHPIYPSVGISVNVTGTPSSTTVYSASSGCLDKVNGPVLGCASAIIPVATSTNKVGTPIFLPHIPTSIIMSASGTNIYVGSCVPQTPPTNITCSGIAVVSTSNGSVTSNFSVTGDVIGVAPSGAKAVVSDTSTSPNLVFLYDQPTNAGTPLLLASADHAKSATFSLDGSTVYIATCTALPCTAFNAGPLYVYDPVNSLRKLPIFGAPITDVAFHPSGAFVYLGGQPGSIQVFNTCDNSIARDPHGVLQNLLSPGTPQFIRAIPDGIHFLALNGPKGTGLEEITASTSGSGCSTPAGVFAADTVSPLVDLGTGVIDASQFLVSSDGLAAYVIPKNFSSVIVYKTATHAPESIALVGAQPPTTGGLTTDGKFLYVGSTDGLLHALDTSIPVDTQQITLSTNSNPAVSMCSISGATQPCYPDFVVIKP